MGQVWVSLVISGSNQPSNPVQLKGVKRIKYVDFQFLMNSSGAIKY